MTNERIAQPEPFEVITNPIGMRMVLIPAGEFLMGNQESAEELACLFSLWQVPEYAITDILKRARPHRVRITKPFYLGLYPVTQAEYEQVMGANPSLFKGDVYRPVSWNDFGDLGGVYLVTQEEAVPVRTNPSLFKGDAYRPVEQVSWDHAVEFCRRLGRKDRRSCRLPTEAEWEYACRAGSTTHYCFGDDMACLDEYAWYNTGSGRCMTHPVGEKKPNAWGLCDMHGNVDEWCADWYDTEYYARSPLDDPQGPPFGEFRVLRGGSCHSTPLGVRSAHRHFITPGDRGSYFCDCFGFRVAMTP